MKQKDLIALVTKLQADVELLKRFIIPVDIPKRTVAIPGEERCFDGRLHDYPTHYAGTNLKCQRCGRLAPVTTITY